MPLLPARRVFEGGPAKVREFSLFRINRKQAIRIPVEFELPGDRALIRKEGEQLINWLIQKAGLFGLLSHRERMDKANPDITDPLCRRRTKKKRPALRGVSRRYEGGKIRPSTNVR